jgi:hypothetical protein
VELALKDQSIFRALNGLGAASNATNIVQYGTKTLLNVWYFIKIYLFNQFRDWHTLDIAFSLPIWNHMSIKKLGSFEH